MLTLTHAKKSLLSTAIVSILSSTSVSAEEVKEQDEIEVIETTVSARRKDETIIEVPMAISSISAMEIADRNYQNAEDIYRSLAGAAMPRGQLILRGLSGGNSAAPDTTSTFVDDIPIEFTNLSDVERVEVLRGPQGTLYGSNAIGGTVRIITKKPVLDEFELFGSMLTGSEKDVEGYDTNMSLGINIPLVDGAVALRVNGNLQEDQRQYTNINTGLQSDAQSNFIRSQLLWQVKDEVDITLGYSLIEDRARGYNQGDTSKPDYIWKYNLTENPEAKYGYDVDFYKDDSCGQQLSRPECLSGSAPISDSGVPGKYQLFDAIDPWSKSKTDLFTLNVNVDNIFDVASLAYAGSYRKTEDSSLHNWSRLDGLDIFKTWIINDWPVERTTHELRIQNLDISGPLSWTLGSFYDRSERNNVDDYQAQYHEGGDIATAVIAAWWDWEDPFEVGETNFKNRQQHWQWNIVESYAEELSFFADVSYAFDLGDAGELELNGGVRHYNIKDGLKDTGVGMWWDGESEESGEESGQRYKLSASYRPTNDMSVYGLYTEGYRPGGNNSPLSQSCASDPKAKDFKKRYESDQIENYELGLKGSAFDHSFNYALAIYQINWSGMLTDVYMDTCGFSYTANGGKARSRGFEFESTLQIADELKMSFNTSYTNSTILEDNDAISALKGDDMTMVPKWNGYLALDQGFSLMGKQAYIRADYSYYGDYKTHFDVRDEDKVPSYGVVNLSTRFEVSGDVTLSLHINNLLDDDAIKYKRARKRSETNTTAQNYIEYLQGRSIGIRLDYTFF